MSAQQCIVTSLLQYIHHQKIMKKVYVVYSLHLAELVAPRTSSCYRIYSSTMRGFFSENRSLKVNPCLIFEVQSPINNSDMLGNLDSCAIPLVSP